jgi:prepilin-type N-terminal cleavage/methylation domain-containing protein
MNLVARKPVRPSYYDRSLRSCAPQILRGLRRTGRAFTQRRALTLIELMVVLVLLGLAATVVTVELQGTTQGGRLRSATVQIEQVLRLARHLTARSHRPTWLEFERGSGRYRVLFGSRTGSQPGNWHLLQGVVIVGGGFPKAPGAESAAGQPGHDDAFTIRIGSGGSTLPFALELQAGAARRLLWTDGVTGRVRFRDGVRLGDFNWADPDVVMR